MLMKRLLFSAAIGLLGAVPMFAGGPSFTPDATFHGSTLTGFHTMGQASWHAENGELIGTPQNGGAGWLFSDKSYQDVGLFANFRCTGDCETGAMFRIEKSGDGWKGIFVSLTEPDTPSYSVTVDAQGKIVTREKLRRGGGLIRVAPPANPNAPTPRFNIPHYNVKLPLTPPDFSLRPNEWNEIEFMYDANIVRAVLNDGRESGGVTDENGYGPFALYVAGSGEVRFKDVAYTNLGLRVREPNRTSSDFRKQQLNDFYYSMTTAAADFNHDGVLDVVSGPYIYWGPDYTKRSEIELAETTSPSTSFNSWWVEYAEDFTGDGWPDVINVTYGGPTSGVYLYVNPKGENRRWDKYKVVPNVQSEIAMVGDVDGSKKPAVVFMGDGYVSYAKPDPANPTGPWIVKHVSEQGYGTAHGIGIGDVNGDGRADILNVYGWWEQPASPDEPWKYHPQAFGRYGHGIVGGAVMAVYDVNGDGKNDVVTVLNAHGWGMAWYEQKRDAQGNISFVEHMVMDDLGTKKENAGGVVFSEPHGTTFTDMDGDGIPDFIVGKRYWSHNADYLDPNPFGQPVLYWYKTVRDPKAPGGARLEPHFVDNNSGAGSTLLAVDLNKDGAVDIVSGSKLGTYIFWGKPKSGASAGVKK